jgi:hypothetical protein
MLLEKQPFLRIKSITSQPRSSVHPYTSGLNLTPAPGHFPLRRICCVDPGIVGPILQIAKTMNGQAAGMSHALIGQSLDVCLARSRRAATAIDGMPFNAGHQRPFLGD